MGCGACLTMTCCRVQGGRQLVPAASLLFLSAIVPAQHRPSTSMGVSTGVARPAQKDAEHRPITAGGFVDNAPVVFVDATKNSGLTKFHHRSGLAEKRTILETVGSGVALLEYDNGGWLDVYLLNGSRVAALKGREPSRRAMLVHCNHVGRVTDVTARAGWAT